MIRATSLFLGVLALAGALVAAGVGWLSEEPFAAGSAPQALLPAPEAPALPPPSQVPTPGPPSQVSAPGPRPPGGSISGFTWTCEPGPIQVAEMDFVDGYFKRRRREAPRFHQFYFTRAIYTDYGRFPGILGDNGPAWSIDYPMADRVMMAVATRLSDLDACPYENPVSLADPDLRRFPFVYTLEWGQASLQEQEVLGLRGFLEAGGLLMIDDFWGSYEWANMERQLSRVLPDRQIVDIPRDHVLFRSYYQIEGDIVQVPNVGNGRRVGMGYPGARTSEQDGYVPYVRGVFDDAGRLMVVIYANTDLGDALEWAEDPYYPLMFSRFASEIFLNTIIYAMTQ